MAAARRSPPPPPPLLHLIFISMFLPVLAQPPATHNNITLGSTLTADSKSENSKWVSPNGEFAFGFYPITPATAAAAPLYLVGVWFENISDKTLAWTAHNDNRAIAVEKGSTLLLSATGLHLSDSHARLQWSTPPTPSQSLGAVSAAAMLDTGNFVLLNQAAQAGAGPIWQSFDVPTDTLLPGQILNWKSSMYSKASIANYSSGRFELIMQDDGNLVLYPVERVGEEQGAYWSTNTYQDSDSPSNLKFDESGDLYLVNNTMRIWNLADGDAGKGRFLRRVTVDTDGILRQYVWNVDGDSSWSSVWRAMEDPCKDVKGQCGRNGVCQLNFSEPVCICPPGFDFIDKEDQFKGCVQVGQSCSGFATNYKMLKLDNTDWTSGGSDQSHFPPMSSNDYSVLKDVTETECKQVCMDDCMCVVVTYENSFCRKKRMPLIDGRQAADISVKAFVKVNESGDSDRAHAAFPNSHSAPLPGLPNEERRKPKALLKTGISLLGCSSILAAAALLIIIWLCWCAPKSRIIREQDDVEEGLKAFAYKDIEAATEGFKEEIGRDAFGKVYKGTLPDGSAIAVKMLDKLVQDEEEFQFRTQVSVIGMCHHKNLVQLYGFCDHGLQKLLVYEYVSNGSLDKTLFVDSGSDFLSWKMRVQIALGIGRGILYLHEQCTTQMIHSDISPQNILLDENYNPKILSEFGLAKLMRTEQTPIFTGGGDSSKCYTAPEWHKNMAITVKVDVYSFGVMLLEIVCCRKTLELDVPEHETLLTDWVYECLKNGSLLKLVEKQQQLEGNTIEWRHLERMVMVGVWCVQQNPSLRPSMKKVLQMLEGSVEIAVPPSPASFISSL